MGSEKKSSARVEHSQLLKKKICKDCSSRGIKANVSLQSTMQYVVRGGR